MKTKTCPHCNEVAVKRFTMDTGDLDGILTAWSCTECNALFYTRHSMEDEDE